MKRTIFAACFAVAALLTACDDGRIYPNVVYDSKGKPAKIEGVVTGTANWPEGYNVAFAGFTDDDDYARISKAVQPDADGHVSTVMTNVPDDVTSVQLCVLDRLRRHVATLAEVAVGDERDTIRLEVGTVDASMLNTIQQSYFNTTCANCHGASNRTAANLNLTEGHSYAALVGVSSTKVSDALLVAPGDAENSVLHMVLWNETVEGISMNHFDLVSEKNAESILPLIDEWINSGAPEN